jgi:retinol dehydrogenase 12
MAATKTALITGANSGIGLATAKLLAQKGFHIILLCRKQLAGEQIAKELMQLNTAIIAQCYAVELSDFESIKKAAADILLAFPRIDVLVNNAGYYPDAIEYVHGVEKTTYASHIGHFLLTRLLMPALERSPEARIINVSSAAHQMGRIARPFQQTESVSAIKAYGDAKLANVLFTMGLAKRLPAHITTYSLHPGVVSTRFASETTGLMGFLVRLGSRFLMTPEKGAATSVYLATEPIAHIQADSGKYFDKCKVKKSPARDLTADKAEWLWEKSEAVLRGV